VTAARRKKRVGIIGASGYTGYELIGILRRHPGMKLIFQNSPSFAGKPVSSLYPDFRGSLRFTGLSTDQIATLEPDLVFLGVPSGEAMGYVPDLPCKAVDLSADYRFEDKRVFDRVYGIRHTDRRRPAVYGLPEINREDVRRADLVANPGCYVTACLLAALPAVRAGIVDRVVFDAKSGYSGSGRKPSAVNDPKNYTENIIPYKVEFHRHLPEIEQILGMRVSFTPQVIPAFRGILAAMHAFGPRRPRRERLIRLYREFYRGEPFVRVIEGLPDLHQVQGTNLCVIGGFHVDPNGRVLVLSAIDNLQKGASGQAVQNANLMLGLPETQGLTR